MTAAKEVMPLAVTPGEPAGVGPDIVLQLAKQDLLYDVIIVGSLELIQQRALELALDINIISLDKVSDFDSLRKKTLQIIDISLTEPVQTGKACPANGGYVLNTLDTAIELCQTNQLSGLVTGPVNKAVINEWQQQQGKDATFKGHTEYLAEKTDTEQVVMMLAAEEPPALSQALRVALATTHLPLKEVSERLSQTSIEKTLRILHADLINKYGIEQPTIAVCGLNPHAGENGLLGDEEQCILVPVIKKLLAEGMNIGLPLPADTLFTDSHLQGIDAVLSMFHDQGLPVLKSHAFGRAVNITLGLPIIRTSVDHGTALDIAGKSLNGTPMASPDSLFHAIGLARKLAKASQS